MEKMRYSDELGARAATSVLCDALHQDELFVYKCPHCLGWHATKKQTGNIQKRKVTSESTFIDNHMHQYGETGRCSICKKQSPLVPAVLAVSRWRARYEELLASDKVEAAERCLEELRHWEAKADRIRTALERRQKPPDPSDGRLTQDPSL